MKFMREGRIPAVSIEEAGLFSWKGKLVLDEPRGLTVAVFS